MKINTIKTEYTTSFNTGGKDGAWHRIGFAIEVAVEEDDNLEDVKRKAWNTCEVEVQKQLDDILGA